MSVIIDGVEYYGIIYKIENIVNHKVYIGQTTNPRGFNGRYYYKGVGAERVYNYMISKKAQDAYYNPYMLRSMEIHGVDSFVVDEVLDTAMTYEELNDKEVYYIKKFDSYHNGYNLTYGGDSGAGYDRPKSGECKNSKRLYQIDANNDVVRVWECATDAERELGINQTSISMVCNGRRRLAGGYVWVHECDYDENRDYTDIPPKQSGKNGCYVVCLLDEDGNIQREFQSINKAAKSLDICVESVRKICQHKFENPRYNLVYKTEYMEEQRLSGRGLTQQSGMQQSELAL